jgi:hypothetical protein
MQGRKRKTVTIVQDNAEEIQNIEWTVYGKISRIERNPTSDKADLEFEYTPDGHRSLKRVYSKNPCGSISVITETYYIRDASGNIMATYSLKNQEFKLNELHIYSSSRLGLVETNMLLNNASGPVNNPLPPDEVEFTEVRNATPCPPKRSAGGS